MTNESKWPHIESTDLRFWCVDLQLSVSPDVTNYLKKIKDITKKIYLPLFAFDNRDNKFEV